MTLLNCDGFTKLIEGDLEWLALQPSSLERMHVEGILKYITKLLYDDKCSCGQTRHLDIWESYHD